MPRTCAVFLISCLLCLSPALQAQSPFFRSYRLSKEIGNLKVTRIFQDAGGFLWIGNSEGIMKFDGLEFARQLLPDSLPHSVSALSADASGKMWAGFSDGRIAFLEANSWKWFEPDEGLPKVPITGILAASDSIMCFSTYGEGIYFMRNDRLYNINHDDGLGDDYVYVIVADKTGRIWAGSDAGISVCKFDGEKKKIRNISVADGLTDNIVRDLAIDQNGLLWAGTYEKGICRYDPELNRFFVPQEMKDWSWGAVNAMEVFGNEVWIATQGGGLLHYVGGEESYIRAYGKEHDFPYPVVNDLCADQEGNLWIAPNAEVILAAGRQFEFISFHENHNFSNVHSILADNRHNLWFSTDEGLFMHSTRFTGRNTITPYLNEDPGRNWNIISLYQDPDGRVWAGTFGSGVFRIDPDNKSWIRYTETDGLVNGNVLSISGKDREIWFATLGGASRCLLPEPGSNQKLQFETFSKESGLGNNFIYDVFADSKGRIWFATDGQGVSVIENGKFTTYGEESGLKSTVIYSLTEDHSGNIWFSTATAGVYAFAGDSLLHFDLSNGLRELSVTALATDGLGNILMVHKLGLDVYHPNTEAFTYHGAEAGILDIDPDLNVASADLAGHVWLGTKQGLIRYASPEPDWRLRPKIVLTGIELFLEPLSGKEHPVFGWNQNHLTFQYSGLWFTDPEKVSYQHKLEGYDSDWIPSTNREAIFSNLPAGNYRFRVRAALGKNFLNAEEQSYAFRIRKPVWATAWFAILLSLLALSAVYAYIRIRENQLRKRELLEKERIRFQFETLKSQVNPHFLFNSFNTLISLIEAKPRLAVEYVERLSDLFRTMLTHREEEVIPLKEELELIENYYYLQKKRFGDNFSLDIQLDDEKLTACLPPLTLQMLVENALKHNIVSSRKPLKVEIFCTEDGFLCVRNNLQEKTRKSPSTGLGLQNIRNRYQLISSQPVEIRRTDTHFEVIIPLLSKL